MPTSSSGRGEGRCPGSLAPSSPSRGPQVRRRWRGSSDTRYCGCSWRRGQFQLGRPHGCPLHRTSRHGSTRDDLEAVTRHSEKRSIVRGFGRTQKARTTGLSNGRDPAHRAGNPAMCAGFSERFQALSTRRSRADLGWPLPVGPVSSFLSGRRRERGGGDRAGGRIRIGPRRVETDMTRCRSRDEPEISGKRPAWGRA